MASQLTHELNTLRAERDQMLEGLEALGWPCHLVELPAYAMKSDREIDRLRAALVKISIERDAEKCQKWAIQALSAEPSSDETSDG